MVKQQENSHKHTKRDGSECQELVTGVTNDYYPVHYCRFSFQSFTNPQSCKFAVCHNCYEKVHKTKTNQRPSRTRQTHADKDKMKEKNNKEKKKELRHFPGPCNPTTWHHISALHFSTDPANFRKGLYGDSKPIKYWPIVCGHCKLTFPYV